MFNNSVIQEDRAGKGFLLDSFSLPLALKVNHIFLCIELHRPLITLFKIFAQNSSLEMLKYGDFVNPMTFDLGA